MEAKAIKSRIVVVLEIGAYVSKLSTPFFCLKPCTINLALNQTTEPYVLCLTVKIHLHPRGVQLGDKSAKTQVLLPMIEFISSLIASS